MISLRLQTQSSVHPQVHEPPPTSGTQGWTPPCVCPTVGCVCSQQPCRECHSWEQFLPYLLLRHQLPFRATGSPSSSSASNQQLKNQFNFINRDSVMPFEIPVRNRIPPAHHSYFTKIETPDLRHLNFCSVDKEKGKHLNGYRLQ